MTAPLNLDALEAAARAATGGDWKPGVVSMPAIERGTVWAGVGKSYDSTLIFAATGPADCQQSAIDAVFIAAANPAVVLALIERLREAEASEEHYRKLAGELRQQQMDSEGAAADDAMRQTERAR